MTRRHVASCSKAFLAVALAGLLSSMPRAAGPRAVNGLGQPMRWSTAGAIVYNPDQGTLGLLSNAQARALIAEAFAEWTSAAPSLTFAEGASLPQNVDAAGIPFTNPAHFQNFYRVSGDGRSPVIFDADGSIIDAIFGVGARFEVLGVAGLDTPIGAATEITEASIVINGAFFDGIGLPTSPEDVTSAGFKATMVHEIGHFLNLDHSLVNFDLALDGNAGNDIYVPTMCPALADDDGQLATTNPDDRLSVLNLYPPGAPTRRISGSVLSSGIPFQGANVTIRKLDDPLMTAYSLISGGLFFPCSPGSTCDPCSTACDPGNPPAQGAFGADFFPAGPYRVCVEQIDTRLSLANSTFVGPLATPPILPGPEECFDVAEAGTQADDPDDAATVIAGSGVPADFLLNALPSSDPFEPNNTLATGAVLDDLAGAGRDTAPALLGPGDLDVYQIPVTAGQRVRIDIDAAELGSTLDAVIGFYNASNVLVARVDDAFDPDSQAFSLDPALELTASFTGIGKIVVSSYPDFNQTGSGGATTGPYWIRVEVESDTDGDGVADGSDICPTTAKDDADRDGRCFGADNCPTDSNPLQDAPQKISGTMVSGGDVSYYNITSDDATIFYLADQDSDEVFELYSVPTGGGSPPVRLNPSLAGTGKDVVAVLATPTDVVYLADQDTDGRSELYRVPIGGGATTKLNGALPAGGNVLEFNISPDGSRVVYRADQDSLGIDELYSVPIGGGATTKLNGTMTPGGSIVDPGPGFTSFLFTPDSARVIYKADQDTFGIFELYSVPLAGGAVVKLNPALIPAGDTGNFQTDGVGIRLLFTADATTDQRFELYSVPVGGGTPIKISGAMVGGSGGVNLFRVSFDGSRAVYRADQDTAGRNELYSVSTSGGSVTKLNPALVAGGNVQGIALPVGPDDGDRMTYRADQEVDNRFEIYSVPITGGSVIKLNAALVAGGNVTGQGGGVYQSQVLFIGDQDVDEQFELYSVPATGGTPVKLTGTMVSGGDQQGAFFDAQRVAVLADRVIDGVVEVFGVRLDGGAPLRLNGTLVGGGNVTSVLFTIADDPGVVVYLADQDANDVFELYSRTFSLDSDADGVFDRCDVCVDASDAGQTDADGNGVGDACQSCALGADPDSDAVCSASDNCPTVPNAGQADFDLDGAGDACDEDDDDDGLLDVVETNTGTFVDPDHTGSDPLDADSDDDGVPDGAEVAAGTDPNDPGEIGSGIPFGAARTISASADGAAMIFVADIDGDGDADIVSATQDNDEIAWYANIDGAGTFGSRQVITNAADGAFAVFAADLDGDGDLDVISASENSDTISWHENDGTPGGLGDWSAHGISLAADRPRSVFAADLDRDGDLDVLSASLDDDEIAWYENTDGAGTFGSQQLISTSADGAESVTAADVDGDGDLDVLSASFADDTTAWYENDGTPGGIGDWTYHEISATGDGADSVAAADLDGDGDVDVLSASWTDAKIVWYANANGAGSSWTPHLIATTSGSARSVVAADIDSDGDLDVLSGSRTGAQIVLYRNIDGAASFAPGQLISAAAGEWVVAADVDGDGDTDALASSHDAETVSWFENRTTHRDASFAAAQVIATVASPYHLIAADINGDGRMDTVSASTNDDKVAWYQNNGASPPGWTARTVSTAADGVEFIVAADVDRDGDLDLLSASFNDDKIAWYENNGGSPPVWTERSISTTADGAWWVGAGDLDGDGDLDVVSASFQDTTLAWYENDGAIPTPGWTRRTISTSIQTRRCAIGDADGDGDLDILAPRIGPGTIAFYRNDGGAPLAWTVSSLVGTGIGTPNAVTTADVDGDGDLDVIATASADSLIAWYENNGAPSPGWTLHTIPRSNVGWFPVFASDLDGDGDTDLLSACGGLTDLVVWSENDGASPPAWTDHTIAIPGDVNSVTAADVDGDGDNDILTVARPSGGPTDQLLFLENRGGQFRLTTTAIAPAAIVDGAKAAVLKITMTSNGRTADGDVELVSLELLITDTLGATLSSAEANALIERLQLYLDNGSGTFEEAADTAVATVEDLNLSPLVVGLVPGDPRVRVAAGQSKTYFLVLQTAAGASTHSPNAFRVRRALGPGSQARDAASGVLLREADSVNAPTATITAVSDGTAPFVTGVIPPNGTLDVARSATVSIYMSEQIDASTAEAGVSLAKGGIKVAGRVTVSDDGLRVTIDPLSLLELDGDYRVEVTSALKDRTGNAAVPFTSIFEVTSSVVDGEIPANEFGDEAGGRTVGGANADDNSGFAVAALRDVNATLASHGISDLIIGAPNADAGGVDAGKAVLIFGAPGLQSNAGAVTSLTYQTGTAGDFIGETVAGAGDVNRDGVQDFLIGAPRSDQGGTDAGVIYLVFGSTGLFGAAPGPLDLDNLASCAAPTLCGVRFVGASAGDLAGASISAAGDVDGDHNDDILIGAPGATPPGRTGAGKVYLIFGPLANGTIPLSSVGSTTRGLVFHGESAGDEVGAAVSQWRDGGGDGLDDLLLGAPGASVLGQFGTPVSNAGYVYAIQGGKRPGHLDDTATPGVIELSRVANGLANQVAGMVFLGDIANRRIGRSITGAVDTNGDGIDDVLFTGNGVAFAIPGDDPKVVIGTTQAGTVSGFARPQGIFDARADFGATVFLSGDSDPLTVGAAGDLDRDGLDDFIIGAPLANGPAGVDSGLAYVVLGTPAGGGEILQLAAVGDTVPGFIVQGVQPGDNLGASVGGGLDLNGDGVDDGLVGAPFADSGMAAPENAGETYVISPIRPDEIAGVVVQKLGGGVVRVEWGALQFATSYSAYRGSLATVGAAHQVRTSAMTQAACKTLVDTDADLLPDLDDATAGPAPGGAFFWLVTANNLQGEGPIGPAGLNPPRVNDASCP